MAEYRAVHSKIYRDEWYARQSPEAKLLFLYLFTNEHTSVSGIYELPVKFIAVETSLAETQVRRLLKRFHVDGKIEWQEPIIWVKRMREYQATQSPKVIARIQKDLSGIPDTPVKQHYVSAYGIATVPIGVLETASDTDTDTETGIETETETGMDTKVNDADAPPTPKTPEPKSKVLTAQQQMIHDLAQVMGLDDNLNGGRLSRLARDLLKQNYKPEQIIRTYCRDGPYYANDWRGKKGQLPTEAVIRETIKGLSNGRAREPKKPPGWKGAMAIMGVTIAPDESGAVTEDDSGEPRNDDESVVDAVFHVSPREAGGEHGHGENIRGPAGGRAGQ